jgi:4-amino-4-deoxy-L-arabinose transferase-like glycosyltransferase
MTSAVSPSTGRVPDDPIAPPPFVMARKAGTILTTGLLLVLFLVQGILFIRANSQTVDEAVHLAAGYSYLTTADFRLDSEHPPLIKALQALPLLLGYRIPFDPDPQAWNDVNNFVIGHDFLYKSAISADRMLSLPRLITLLLGGFLLVVIGLWAYRLWGCGAALLAMSIAGSDPNLLAHSSLVTTDIGVTLFIFLAVYLLWEYVNSPTWARLVATGICTGMALVSKFSALVLIPIVLVIAALLSIGGDRPLLLPLKENSKLTRTRLFESAAVLLVIFVFAFLTIPPAYFFQGFAAWLSGLQLLLNIMEEGRPAFFLGDYSHEGWWNYFLTAFVIKTPIGTMALVIASLGLYRVGAGLRSREAVFLLAPVIVFFAVTTQSKMAIGVRHILPVYPFLFVLASRLATVQFGHRWLAALLFGTLVVLTAISSLRTAPHQLAYFNEIVGGPDRGHQYLSDSNIDWGQGLKQLKAYMEKEKLPIIYLSYFGTAPPSYYGIRYQDVGRIGALEWPPPADKVPADAARKILAISVYNLQDVSRPRHPLFRWLWKRQPIEKIGYSIFIYDLTNDPEGLMKLYESYDKSESSTGPERSLLVRLDPSAHPFPA